MAKKAYIERIPEPEVMDDSEEAGVYDAADFNRVNRSCARRICKLLDADRDALVFPIYLEHLCLNVHSLSQHLGRVVDPAGL